jgi:predicted amidohydrolase
MAKVRIALANLLVAATPEESVARVEEAIAQAGREGAAVVCFPECYVPGYRTAARPGPRPDAAFLTAAWARATRAAAQAKVTVILGTERVVDGDLRISALVIQPDGTPAGFQDKVQLDPSEDGIYAAGSGRRMFQASGLRFGVVICHEGWRYPETVRWAARRGAQVVFHPHVEVGEPGGYRPTAFAEPGNTFHEKAMLCRAAENTCYFASVNVASAGAGTTSAVARPDGTLACHQPYGQEGLLLAEIETDEATGLLAARWKGD